MSATITLDTPRRSVPRTRLLAAGLALAAAAGLTTVIAVTADGSSGTHQSTQVTSPESHAHPDPLVTRYGIGSHDASKLYAGRR